MIGKVFLPINTGGSVANWAPPTDWQDISQTATNQIKYLVADTNLTYAFKATTSTGTYTIDWGDGTIDSACVSGTQYQHTYTRGAGVACSRGYTTFVISIIPNTGNLLTCKIAKHTLLTVQQSHDILYANIKNATFLNDYSNMFSVSGAFCPQLESVIMPTSWTVGATTIYVMFNSCYSLQSVTLPTSWGSITNISGMFQGCYSLQSVTLPTSWGSIMNIGNVFQGCYSLQSITLPTSWGSITNVSYMFSGCYSLQSITLPTSWGSITNVSYMFSGCYSLQSVILPISWGSITNVSNVFQGCYSLQSITLPISWGSITNVSSMFNSCYSLQSVTLPISWGSITNVSSMFNSCYSLQSITLPTSWGSITNVFAMFYQCNVIQYNSGMQYLGSKTSQCDFSTAFVSTQNIDGSLTFDSQMSKFTFSGTSGNLNHITGLLLTNQSSLFEGLSPQIDIAYNNLDNAALTDLANSLPSLSGKTIRITGCPGAGVGTQSYDTIFTNKGWTINRTN
jgi:hypothetical protein